MWDLRIYSIGLGLVTIEAHHRELSFDLPRVNTDDPDPLGDQFLSQAFCERSDGRLGRTVDATANVWLPTGNGANVDDVAGTFTIVALEHAGEYGLGHVDKTSHVGREHDGCVFFLDLRGLVYALHETTDSTLAIASEIHL